MIEIPKQLQKEGFRFILLKKKSKVPFEEDWQNTKNYCYDDPILLKHLENDGNYGVVGGYGNLIILDADNKEFADSLFSELLTLTIQTCGGGFHFFFISDYNKNHKLKEDLGEVRANKYMVVGANCYAIDLEKKHEGWYKIINDLPIKEMTKEDFEKLIKPYLRKEIVNITIKGTTEEGKKILDNSRSGIEYREVIKLIGLGLSKNKIYEYMSAFEKWNNAPEQYRELTYNKAEKYVMERKEREKIEYLEIWNIDDKGKKKLIHKNIALNLINQNKIITIGESKNEIYYYSEGIYKPNGENFIAQNVQDITEGCIRINDVNEVIGHIKRLTLKDRKILENKEYNLICVKNGILNINSLELIEHTSDLIFTQKINVNFIKDKECPNIKQFFKDILKEEDTPIIQEFLGYLLYRKYFIKKAIICVGEPHTGKTTFINLLVKFIGEENTSGISLHKILTDKFSAMNLQNKLLNYYDDLSFRDINETGSFKIATGGGYISAEKKFGECFQFMNYAKLLFATNKISAIQDTEDMAYYDRWIILFFNNIFDDENEKTDKHLIDKIITEEEVSGLLNWALEGLKRLLLNNKISYNKTPEENKLIMERCSNSLSAFVQDCLIEKNGNWLPKEELYWLYSIYINEYGGARVTKERFGRDLTKKATYIIEGRKDTKEKKSVHGWLNIGLNTTFTTFWQTLYNIKYIKNKEIKKIIYNNIIPLNKENSSKRGILNDFIYENNSDEKQENVKPLLHSDETTTEKPILENIDYPTTNFPCQYPIGNEEICKNINTFLVDGVLYLCEEHIKKYLNEE